MEFSRKEMAALLKAAKMMAVADGVMTTDEKEIIKADLSKFGVKLDTIESLALEATADNMEGVEVISTLSAMLEEQKKYACSYLAVVMMADGVIDEKEMELWRLFSLLVGFPTMNVVEAVDFWRNH